MQIVKAPDGRLRFQTKPVIKINSALLNTLKEMVKLTKTFKDPEGVGLAANQVGLEESFFVVKNGPPTGETGEKFIKVINPKLISTSKRTKKYFEGCLSVPNMWGEVIRHTNIRVSYQDETGKNVTQPLRGVLAWIFQHEIDHLNGLLFSDKVLEFAFFLYKFIRKKKTQLK